MCGQPPIFWNTWAALCSRRDTVIVESDDGVYCDIPDGLMRRCGPRWCFWGDPHPVRRARVSFPGGCELGPAYRHPPRFFGADGVNIKGGSRRPGLHHRWKDGGR